MCLSSSKQPHGIFADGGGLSAHTSKKKKKKKRKKQIGDSARKLNIALLYSVPLITPKIIPPEGL